MKMQVEKFVRPEATDYKALDRISEIDCQAFVEDGISVFNLAQFARSGSVFALEIDGEILAEAVMLRNFDDNGANVFGFAVDNAHTSKGLGAKLMQHLLDFARNVGISYLELTMNPDDERAKSFYMKKFGFIKKTDLELHPKKPQKRWLMRLDL
ncbi:MAG: hypothetical protein Kow0029_04500 [Candidatus Rifleibacteriota bacterium]